MKTKKIKLNKHEEMVEIEINGITCIRVTNRLEEYLLIIDVLDADGTQVINQTIEPDVLGL